MMKGYATMAGTLLISAFLALPAYAETTYGSNSITNGTGSGVSGSADSYGATNRAPGTTGAYGKTTSGMPGAAMNDSSTGTTGSTATTGTTPGIGSTGTGSNPDGTRGYNMTGTSMTGTMGSGTDGSNGYRADGANTYRATSIGDSDRTWSWLGFTGLLGLIGLAGIRRKAR